MRTPLPGKFISGESRHLIIQKVKITCRYPKNPQFTGKNLSFGVVELIMAAKILANLIVMGGSILARAFVQAYRQALANASKNGVAQETIQNTIRRASKVMTEQEARQILGVTEETPWEEIVKRYDNLFESNAKSGSFYLQSKVHRAKERLEAVQRQKGQDTPT